MTNSYSPFVSPVDASQYGTGLGPQGEHVAPAPPAAAPSKPQAVIETWGDYKGEPWQNVAHYITSRIQSKELLPIELLKAARDLHTAAMMPSVKAKGNAALKALESGPGDKAPNAWAGITYPARMVRLTYNVGTAVRFGNGAPVTGPALPSTRFQAERVTGEGTPRYGADAVKITGEPVQNTRGYVSLLAAAAKANGCPAQPKGAGSKVTWDLIISDPIKAFDEASKLKGLDIAVERIFQNSYSKDDTKPCYQTVHISVHRSDVPVSTQATSGSKAEAGLTPDNIIGF